MQKALDQEQAGPVWKMAKYLSEWSAGNKREVTWPGLDSAPWATLRRSDSMGLVWWDPPGRSQTRKHHGLLLVLKEQLSWLRGDCAGEDRCWSRISQEGCQWQVRGDTGSRERAGWWGGAVMSGLAPRRKRTMFLTGLANRLDVRYAGLGESKKTLGVLGWAIGRMVVHLLRSMNWKGCRVYFFKGGDLEINILFQINLHLSCLSDLKVEMCGF